MERHGADALQVAVRCLTQGIRSDNDETQTAAAEQIIRIAKHGLSMPKAKEHIVNLIWTTAEQQTLQQLVTDISFKWRLAYFSLVLGDMEDKNVRGKWIQSWSEIDDLSETPSLRWLREDFILMLVRQPAEYLPAELEMHLPEAEEFVSSDPPPQKAVLFCPLPGQVRHLQWWIQPYFGDYVDIFGMYAEMDSQERTDMQLRFQHFHNPSVFITTPKAFTRVERLRQNHVPHTWLLNTGLDSYDDRVSELYHRSGVAEMWVLQGLMNRPDIPIDMIYQMVKERERHTEWLTQGQ
ncbi:hypothetical protein BDD12DRAFT_810966 [Trichophaea hybrida]|nr:hypothetical protein BDD12DRAFT_810966 [Trichophaea hybrida]